MHWSTQGYRFVQVWATASLTVMTFPLNGSIRTSPVKHNRFKHTNYTGNRLHASFLLSSLLFVMRLNKFNSHHAAFTTHSPAVHHSDSEAVLKCKELSAWPHMAEMTSVCDIIPAAPPGDATHEFRWAPEMEWSGRRLWVKTEKRKHTWSTRGGGGQTGVTKYNWSTWEKLQGYRTHTLVHFKLLLWWASKV